MNEQMQAPQNEGFKKEVLPDGRISVKIPAGYKPNLRKKESGNDEREMEMGGTQARAERLDEPYGYTTFENMIKKRGGKKRGKRIDNPGEKIVDQKFREARKFKQDN